jgi:hypothetical protein
MLSSVEGSPFHRSAGGGVAAASDIANVSHAFQPEVKAILGDTPLFASREHLPA